MFRCPRARRPAESLLLEWWLGAIVETDWANVSMGERIPRRKPKSVVCDSSGRVGSIYQFAPLVLSGRLGWDCTTLGSLTDCGS